MNLFDVAAVLITLAAIFGYVNYRFLKLPATTGILILALLSSLPVQLADWIWPAWDLREKVNLFLAGINFNETLMHGMLCFLLFAGSLHLRLEEMRKNKWTIVALATLGVLISTALVGGLAFWVFGMFGLSVSPLVCLSFGALISPTDPIAVLGLLKELKAPQEMEAVIAGESLFNDGVGVVAFMGLLSLAGLESGMSHGVIRVDAPHLAWLFLREVVGGVLLGLGLGYLAYRALKSIDYRQLELLITLALVMFMYGFSFFLGVSGPIAVVVAGLLIGNQGKRYAMSQGTVEHVDAFWGMADDILNAVLFLLIGLVGFDPHLNWRVSMAALAVIGIALGSRFLSVLLPMSALQWNHKKIPGIVPILTWGGLRGGLSVAMVLSLPEIPEKELLLTCTYGVVLFSVLVQGLTMRRVLAHYGVG